MNEKKQFATKKNEEKRLKFLRTPKKTSVEYKSQTLKIKGKNIYFQITKPDESKLYKLIVVQDNKIIYRKTDARLFVVRAYAEGALRGLEM